MKLKDLVAFIFLALVLIIIGSFLVGKIGHKGQGRSANVEVVQPIDPTFSQDAQNVLLGRDSNLPSQSFGAPLNLGSGFGNSDPFAQ